MTDQYPNFGFAVRDYDIFAGLDVDKQSRGLLQSDSLTQQGCSLSQVGSVKPFREPAVDLG